MEFEFLPLAGSGDLPVWFGFAVTYVNPPNPPFFTMQIIGADDFLLANIDLRPLEAYILSIPLDGLSNPVGNDVFVSWQSSEPIKKVIIDGRNSFTMDHWQFGYTIPEPSIAVMIAVSVIPAARIRRRRVPG